MCKKGNNNIPIKLMPKTLRLHVFIHDTSLYFLISLRLPAGADMKTGRFFIYPMN